MSRWLSLALCAALLPSAAFAQDPSHWGVAASLTPTWQVPSQLEKVFNGTVNIKGSDFTIGIARGRELGGDWGVSYSRKTLRDGSLIQKLNEKCFSNGCFQTGTSYTTSAVSLSGVEAHKYVPFVTIKERVQIGMNFAGGVGQFKGNLQTDDRNVTVSFDQRTGRQTATPSQAVTFKPASELIKVSAIPIAKIQAAVAVLVAPGFKVRAAGGLDFPGYNAFSVSGVYFLSRR